MRKKEREKEIGKGERDAVVNSVGHLFAHLLDSVAFGKFKREFSQSKTRTNETREATSAENSEYPKVIDRFLPFFFFFFTHSLVDLFNARSTNLSSSKYLFESHER